MPTTTLGELLSALERVNCDVLMASAAARSNVDNSDDDSDEETVVAENVPEVWNALAEREKLPHGFHLRSLM